MKFIIILLIIVLFLNYKPIAEISTKIISDNDDNIIYKKYLPIVRKYNNNLPDNIILGLITQESGKQIKNGLDSASIVGDNGNSFGIMQVQKAAMTDVNNYYGDNFVITDLKNDYANVEVGVKYLTMCYKKALNENSSNPVFLALRKYNSGINNAKDSNSISIDYANSIINYSKSF